MKKISSRVNLKNFFANEPACVVHGAGTKCVMGKGPSFGKKAEYIFEKLSGINFKTLLPALEKIHKNSRGAIIDVIGRNAQLVSLSNKNPEQAITKAISTLNRKNPKTINLIYTPAGGQRIRGIGSIKHAGVKIMNKTEVVFNKLAQAYGYTGPGGQTVKQRYDKPTGTATSIMKIQAPAGQRYYSGTAKHNNMQRGLDNAHDSAMKKFVTSPADSMTTQQFKDFK